MQLMFFQLPASETPVSKPDCSHPPLCHYLPSWTHYTFSHHFLPSPSFCDIHLQAWSSHTQTGGQYCTLLLSSQICPGTSSYHSGSWWHSQCKSTAWTLDAAMSAGVWLSSQPCVTHSGLMYREKSEMIFTRVIDDSIPMWPSHWPPTTPHTLPGLHMSIKVTNNHILFSCWYCSKDTLKFLVESVPHLSTCWPHENITRHHLQLFFHPFSHLEACWDCSWTPCLQLFPSSLSCINCWAQENNPTPSLLCMLSPSDGLSLPAVSTTLPPMWYTSLPNHLVSCNAANFTWYFFNFISIRSTLLSSPLCPHLLATSIWPSMSTIKHIFHVLIHHDNVSFSLIYVQIDLYHERLAKPLQYDKLGVNQVTPLFDNLFLNHSFPSLWIKSVSSNY